MVWPHPAQVNMCHHEIIEGAKGDQIELKSYGWKYYLHDHQCILETSEKNPEATCLSWIGKWCEDQILVGITGMS